MLVGWACKVILMDLQREIFLMIHALKMEQEQERISFQYSSSLQTPRQGHSLIAQLQHSIESNTGLHLHPLKEHHKLEGKLKHRGI